MTSKALSENQDFLSPLINTVRELSNLISQETNLLKTSRPKELEKLLPLKNQLMATYHKEMAELSSRGGLKASGSGSAARILKQESRNFLTILTRHTRLVEALKKISTNMIKAISDEVVKTQNRSSRYDAKGTRSSNKAPTSITLNQTI